MVFNLGTVRLMEARNHRYARSLRRPALRLDTLFDPMHRAQAEAAPREKGRSKTGLPCQAAATGALGVTLANELQIKPATIVVRLSSNFPSRTFRMIKLFNWRDLF